MPGLRPRSPDDLQRIVVEYAADAIRELDAAPASFTQTDCRWVFEHEVSSFAEIEIATMRIVACYDAGNPHRAALAWGCPMLPSASGSSAEVSSGSPERFT